jgi:hypothetical protein
MKKHSNVAQQRIPFIVAIKFSAYTVPIHEKVEACRRAIREKGAIDQIIMQGIFFGLP